MSFKTYKLIKATTQLVAVAAGVYAMSAGADPMFSFVLIAAILGGQEALEAALSAGSAPNTDDRGEDNA